MVKAFFDFMKQFWKKYASIYQEAHGEALAPGEKRTLVLCTCVEETKEAAIKSVRDGHDEMWKFLGPYGWSKGYMGPDGGQHNLVLSPPSKSLWRIKFG